MTRLRRLVGKRSVRDAERAFVAEGAKIVAAALDSQALVEAIFVTPTAAQSEEIASLVSAAQSAGVRIFVLADGVMERVADAVTPQPILAVASFVDRPIDSIARGTLLVLTDVRDPGNVGAIIRSADASGIDGVIVCEGCADLYSPKVVRASAGSLFHLPLTRTGSIDEVLSTLHTKGFSTVATVVGRGTDYAEADLTSPIALVFGNEANGLSDEVVSRCTDAVTIPLLGGAESLNVAMAATVVSFELARRRRHRGL